MNIPTKYLFIDEPKVFIHVVDNIENFTAMDALLETVASIVNCTKTDIKVIGLQPKGSFLIIITMRQDLLSKLKGINPLMLRKLTKFNVDWIQIEKCVVKIVTGKYFCHVLFIRIVNVSLFKTIIITTLSKSILSLGLPSIKLLKILKIILYLPSYNCIHQKANLS